MVFGGLRREDYLVQREGFCLAGGGSYFEEIVIHRN
jgi:hypothetical protein